MPMDSPFTPRRTSATNNEPAQFRILCPAARTGALIGKGGSVVRHLQSTTGAKIRLLDEPSPCDERVIVILGDAHCMPPDCDYEEGSWGPAQRALVKVLERVVWGDGAAGGGCGGEEEVCCRILAGSSQVGGVFGRGSRVVEKIRHDSGAYIRVFPRDHIPACASPGDELIQISGQFSAVKKALLLVSSCLQENHRADAANSGISKPGGVGLHGAHLPPQVDPFLQRNCGAGHHAVDYHSRGYYSNHRPENIGSCKPMLIEEEIIFKLLCQPDKIGSLIGTGGSTMRALQSETGASIKIAEAATDSDERVVVISARENAEQRHSPAQDAVIRVHYNMAEIGFEPDVAIVARLLVHSQQIGTLLGRGGHMISEIRRATGASVHVFPKEQAMRGGLQSEEVVQVIGSLQCVQDALFHITGRLRETIFSIRPSFSSSSVPPYSSPFPDMPPPNFRPKHNPPSPNAYPSAVGPFHGFDHPARPPQPFDHHPSISHADHINPLNLDRGPHPYGSERPIHAPTFENSPRSWTSQGVDSGNPMGATDVSSGFAPRNEPLESGDRALISTSTTVEVVIPQTLLNHVYGENNSNLGHIRQISGANVLVHDPKPGATEGVVLVSGTSDQMHAAQSLIHAFILCGQTS
ncbi:KH domain-containing protein [Tripterygium wilfordii]|uniref:KH domain-containing protein n=1 Tax=Tripterygium wilfordii TaxID=458696 RepID=A0A7J7DSI5_TRIWF|nr:KH domain-containing protein HEN4 isoform X2 [Tripterygium wilfordii]KAF5749362.1 KH domain-containing protein [Tripterygium wilfordii]